MPLPPILKKWIREWLESEGAKNKLYDGDLNAQIDLEAIPDTLTGKDADSVDGHHAGTGANEVLVLDSNGFVPLANIPVLDWTKLQFPGVRQEILAKFSDPKILIATSSMLLLLNSAEKEEAASGNISATSEELTIVGGTSTAKGSSWCYWILPNSASKVYVVVKMNANSGEPEAHVDVGSGDATQEAGSGTSFYSLALIPPNATDDFKFLKNIDGTATELDAEAVDLTLGAYYQVEVFVDGANNIQKVWRDGVLKFDLTDTAITSFEWIRLRTIDRSTTAASDSKFKGMVVIIYE